MNFLTQHANSSTSFAATFEFPTPLEPNEDLVNLNRCCIGSGCTCCTEAVRSLDKNDDLISYLMEADHMVLDLCYVLRLISGATPTP